MRIARSSSDNRREIRPVGPASLAVVDVGFFCPRTFPKPTVAMASLHAPTSPAEVENKYVRAALARLRESPDDADALFVLGVWALSRGHPDKAISYLNAITPRSPTYPGIWRLKARAFEALGDPENAERCRQRGADRFS